MGFNSVFKGLIQQGIYRKINISDGGLPNIKLFCEVDPITRKGANSHSTVGTEADKEHRKGKLMHSEPAH
jgi:hypothetical protein